MVMSSECWAKPRSMMSLSLVFRVILPDQLADGQRREELRPGGHAEACLHCVEDAVGAIGVTRRAFVDHLAGVADADDTREVVFFDGGI